MARRRRTYRCTSYRQNAGYEAARRHIDEARAFSNEIGGSDADVKAYFFNLAPTELDALFKAYGSKYDSSAEAYARLTFSKWKAGQTQMSGLVAKRLFDLLPSRMPTRVKLQLAENIWRHFGPRASIDFTVGPAADASQVIPAVYAKVDAAIQDYAIPENIRARFSWVSGGDVAAKEGLLNHFRQQERALAIAILDAQLPILQTQMRDHAQTTGSIKTTVNVHSIAVNLWIDQRLGDTFRESAPDRKPSATGGGGGSSGVWIGIAVVVAIFILLSMLRHH